MIILVDFFMTYCQHHRHLTYYLIIGDKSKKIKSLMN